jgi:hypothetical protein
MNRLLILRRNFLKHFSNAIVNIAYIESFNEHNITTLSKLILPLLHTLIKPLQQLLLDVERLKIPNCSHCEKCKIKNTCTEISMFVLT